MKIILVGYGKMGKTIERIALERGHEFPTQYGIAMLAALDELAEWRAGARLTSDVNSACAAIDVVDGIRRLARENGI